MDNEHMLLELDHISKIYGDLHAVDDLSLTVPQGHNGWRLSARPVPAKPR